MDPLFVMLAVTGVVGYGWLPVRDRVCAARGHRKGAQHLRASFPDGTYETEAVCMCRKTAIITHGRLFSERKDTAWAAPASATTPATSP